MKKNCIFWIGVLPFLSAMGILFFSCDMLRDSPFEVEGWAPGSAYHERPENISVSVLFSHESDRTETERAFSLTEDGLSLAGSFLWEGKRLYFSPNLPLKSNRDYRVIVSTDARDEEGLSLEKRFEASFTTRPPGARPQLVSLSPGYDEVLSGPRDEIRIVFSEPVPALSCVNSISFSPSINGSWRLEGEGKTAVFTPGEAWAGGTFYRIAVSSRFESVTGLTMGEEYSSRFIAGSDREAPGLIGAWRVDAWGELTELVPEGDGPGFTENPGWEGDSRLRLDFSEPVDTLDLRSRLGAEPSPVLVLESPPGFASSLIFGLAERPVFGSRFLFRLDKGSRDAAGNESPRGYIFRIFANGPRSKAPALIGIRLPMDPGKLPEANEQAADFSIDESFKDFPIIGGDLSSGPPFPYNEPVPLWIELYFDTAEGAGADLFSVMDLFGVDVTNNALSFSPKSIRDRNFTWEAPRPGWESYHRLEIRGELTNTVNSGMVVFQIRSGLTDDRGNRNEEIFRIPLLK
jgi:hypothetical protein